MSESDVHRGGRGGGRGGGGGGRGGGHGGGGRGGGHGGGGNGGGTSGGGGTTDNHEALLVSDLDDIQAGPVVAVPTKAKFFLFFTIKNVASFRSWFGKTVLRQITTSKKAREMRQSAQEAKSGGRIHPLSSLTVSFSQTGLNKVLASADTKDPEFTAGQLADAGNLGDTLANWHKDFKQDIHGMFEIISVDLPSCYRVALDIAPGINDAITILFVRVGEVRPGSEKGHEHFGFNDGISQPYVKIEDDKKQKREPYPGQMVVNPGVLLLGRTGDATAGRPDWAKNGSFLVYRQLKQLVPEFHDFLTQTALALLPIGRFSGENRLEKMAAYIGARLMGRYTSGCPVVLTPFKEGSIPEDIPKIGNDPKKNNDFDYGPTDQSPRQQGLCPFAAHTRKTRPRTDLAEDQREKHGIMRSGITYGPEVTEFEKVTKTTMFERGLSFVSYQSTVGLGFHFLQKVWSNIPNFPPNTGGVQPGFDPITGQAAGAARKMTGYDASNTSKELALPKEFVIAEGGEYLFLPSISTLKKIADGA